MSSFRFIKPCFIVLIIIVISFQFLDPLYSGTKSHEPHPSAVPDLIRVKMISAVPKRIPELWTPAAARKDQNTLRKRKRRTEVLLLIRKLAVYSVQKVNEQLEGTECSPWWVNPLLMGEFEERSVSPRNMEYKLTFEAQPGMIPFEAVVLLRRAFRNASNPYASDDLVFVEGKRLDSPPPSCGTVPTHLRQKCLCPEEKERAEKVTLEAREQWKVTDPELLSWPPNVPMSVSDYIRFSSMDLYLTTPSTEKVKFCGPEVKMIVFMSSAPTHFLQRSAIRRTFGNFEFLGAQGVRLVFLFGAVSDSNLQAEIDNEFVEANDIVQANYADSYYNLSLSHLSMYNWVVTQCKVQESQASMPRWVLQAQDDYFLNIPVALRIAAANPEQRLIGCLFCGTKPDRDVASKYYVPKYMFAPDIYPNYLSEVAYLVRTDVMEAMLEASLTMPIVHIDGVLMALLAREVGIRPVNSNLITYVRRRADSCKLKTLMDSYIFNASDLLDVWTRSQEASGNCTFHKSRLKVIPLKKHERKACLYP